MSTYNLTVLASTLNGRDKPNGNIVFPNGFLANDVLAASSVYSAPGESWYNITSCKRNGNLVSIPSPVWACLQNANGTYMHLDSIYADSQNPRASVTFMDGSGKTFGADNIELLPK